MITGSVWYNLASRSDADDRRQLGDLHCIPSGTRVIVYVADRSAINPWAVDWMRQYVDKLHFDVHGSPMAVGNWVMALRGCDPLDLDIARWES